MSHAGQLHKDFLQLLDEDPLGSICFDILLKIEEATRTKLESPKDATEVVRATNAQIDGALKDEIGNSLDGLLGQMDAKVRQILGKIEKVNPEDLEKYLKYLDIAFEKVNFRILTPEETDLEQRVAGSEQKDRFFVKNKLKLLVEALRKAGIFTDDLCAKIGTYEKDGSYVYIQIPSIGKIILLTLGYAAATFVFSDQNPQEEVLRATRPKLVEQYGAKKIKFSDAASEDWQREVIEALEISSSGRRSRKEVFTEKIKEAYPTAEKFMKLERSEIRALRFFGRGMGAVTTIFGMQPEKKITESRLTLAALARLIYGEGHEIIECEFWTTEQWRTKFMSVYSTPESFMQLTQAQVLKLQILGRGIFSIATIFGVDDARAACHTRKGLAEVAKRIYGEGIEVVECELWTQEQWAQKIRSIYPVAENLLRLTSEQRMALKIAGKGLSYIARSVFGLESGFNVISNRKNLEILCGMIYR